MNWIQTGVNLNHGVAPGGITTSDGVLSVHDGSVAPFFSDFPRTEAVRQFRGCAKSVALSGILALRRPCVHAHVRGVYRPRLI